MRSFGKHACRWKLTGCALSSPRREGQGTASSHRDCISLGSKHSLQDFSLANLARPTGQLNPGFSQGRILKGEINLSKARNGRPLALPKSWKITRQSNPHSNVPSILWLIHHWKCLCQDWMFLSRLAPIKTVLWSPGDCFIWSEWSLWAF